MLDRILRAGPAPFLWLALVVGAVYIQTAGFGFTSLDDEHLVLENSGKLGAWASLPRAFRTDVYWRSPGSYYRPFLNLSLMADHALAGDSPRAYHLGNLLLHILACWMVYLCLKVWGESRGRAWAFATIFSVHPALVQAVAWIPGRNDILLTIFVLGSFLSLIRYVSGGQKAWLAGHLAGLALALFTKETALLAPVIFLAYYGAAPQRPPRGRLLLPVAGWSAIFAAWFWLRVGALGTERSLSWPGYIGWAEAGAGLLSYAGKIMLPLNLSVLPLAKDISLHYGAAGLALLAGLSLVGGLRDGKAFGFGAAWFLVFLLPTFIPSAGAINFLEHRLYLPLFGIMLALAQNRGLRRVSAVPGTALVLLLAAVLGVMSFRHSRAFADGTAFWSNAARTSPRSALAHQMLGRQHFRAGRINEAARRYRLSLSLEQSPSAHNDLALACLKQGDLGSAEISFRRVLKMDSSFANVHNNLALIYFQRGQWPPARRHLAEAEKLSPLDPEPPLNIGVLMLELGHPDSAELFLRKALDLDPQNPGALLNLGITLSLQGRRAEALNFLRAAHRCRPDHPLVNLRLAQLYLLLGQAGPAQEHYRAARKAGGPADPRLEK